MTDLDFINAYNEVILENFNAVLKQNFMFQTRIRFLEEQVAKVTEMEESLSEMQSIKSKANDLQNEVNNLKNEVSSRDNIIQNSNKADVDAHRLQTALNTQAQDIQRLNGIIRKLETEAGETNQYVSQLEEMLPNSKRKKLGLEVVQVPAPVKKEEVKEETPISDAIVKDTANGGTF